MRAAAPLLLAALALVLVAGGAHAEPGPGALAGELNATLANATAVNATAGNLTAPGPGLPGVPIEPVDRPVNDTDPRSLALDPPSAGPDAPSAPSDVIDDALVLVGLDEEGPDIERCTPADERSSEPSSSAPPLDPVLWEAVVELVRGPPPPPCQPPSGPGDVVAPPAPVEDPIAPVLWLLWEQLDEIEEIVGTPVALADDEPVAEPVERMAPAAPTEAAQAAAPPVDDGVRWLAIAAALGAVVLVPAVVMVVLARRAMRAAVGADGRLG